MTLPPAAEQRNGGLHGAQVTGGGSRENVSTIRNLTPETSEPSLPRVMWDAWKAYSHRAGGYQSQVLLSLVYFLVLGPSGVLSRLAGKRLLDLDHRTPRASYWVARPPAEPTLAALERPF